MKFFELVPSGTKVQFVRNRLRFLSISLIVVLASLLCLAYNHFASGSVLNFGIDFAGGSQVRLAFAEDSDVEVGDIRTALEELGYSGSSAVTVPDAENEMLVRVKEVLSIDESRLGECEQAVARVGEAELVGFNHPEGGSKLFLKFDSQPVYADVEQALAAAGCEGRADKGFGRPEEFPVAVELIGVGTKLTEQLNERFGAGTVVDIVRSETVGAKVGGQLKVDGVVSLLYAIGFIFLFVMIRFDLRFAPGGIIALSHDAIIVVGAFAVTGKEFNLQTIAALLTIIGYSINDTIVVFDRVRERVALHRDEAIEETTNQALNDTLSRTLLTTGTTLVVVLAVYFLGSGPIKDFAFALIVGLLVGTYSSLYVATPVFLWINRKFYGGRGHLRWLGDKSTDEAGPILASRRAEIDEMSGRTVGELRDEERGKRDDQPAEAEDPAKKKVARRHRRPRPQ
jgi:preprotein translocase subunit SecF